MQGKKVGWAEERVALDADGAVKVETHVTLKIARGGVQMGMNWSDVIRFESKPGGRTLTARSEQSLGGKSTVVHEGKRKGDQFQLRTTVDGNVADAIVPMPKRVVEDRVPSLRVQRLLAAKSGQSVVSYAYNYEKREDVRMESTIVSQSKTRLHGVPATVLEIRSVVPSDNLTMTERMTASGQALETQVGPLFRMVLEDQSIAKDISAATPDMFASASIGLNTALGTAPLRSLVLRLKGVPAGAIANDARQNWAANQLTLALRAHRETPQHPISEEVRRRNLAVTPYIDHDATSIQQLAAQSKGEKSDLARAKAISRTVHQTLRYTLETAPESASAILRGGRGDCSEYSRLTVAVLRAAGLPAREVSGVAYVGDAKPGLGYHAWVEVYVEGRWFPMDPTWNQVPVDASHITLGYGKSTTYVGLVGGIQAVVLSVNGQPVP